MLLAQSLDRDTIIALMLLILCSFICFVAIDYTYSAHARATFPERKERMHLRGFFYTLLACSGILLVVVIYLAMTQQTRRMCRQYALVSWTSSDVPTSATSKTA